MVIAAALVIWAGAPEDMHDGSPGPFTDDNECSGVRRGFRDYKHAVRWLSPCRLLRATMPTAQEIREYLEKHGIQNALTAAVNSAIQAKATNPLEFIGDLLKSKGGSAGGAVQLPSGAQIVQAAACSTMVSHQVPCFVDVGSEAGKKAAAEKDAAAALIQNAAARA